ncbi:MAG: urea carboxylase-associated family protein [Paracoccaceae bacterium]|nr:urea carboxylase-associated family protein [Paracoccaceae bacterium]
MGDATELRILPARYGKAIHLAAGRSLEIVNLHGTQAIDTWAFNSAGPTEFLSLEHTRSRLSRVIPRVGDGLFTTRRNVILTMTGDTSPGIHDTLLCACSPELYGELGCEPSHRSCEVNLHEALSEIGLTAPCTPAPLNLFMNVGVGTNSEVIRDVPKSKPGDAVTLRAEMDAVVVLSACPQDVTPINGADCTPRDVGYRVV